MNDKMHIVIVEDNQTMREGLEQVLHLQGFATSSFADAETALNALQKTRPQIIICDYKLPGMDGVRCMVQAKQQLPDLEAVLITAFGSIELAVQAMQQGAADFITKPFSADEIGVKLERIKQRILERQQLERLSEENQYLRQQVDNRFNYGDIIGESAPMQKIFSLISKIAPTDSSVIIYGESGTGKELVARALHKNSLRAQKPFVTVNCGALAESVLESELFGHEKGAFTGALKRKRGRFELAHEGTLFLDEIGDISASTQVKLLRVLQEKEFERVGGEETVRVNVRVIAATNCNLQAHVAEGKFREDLYYRLHIVPITLPPLRQRKEDIPLLVAHFLKKLGVELRKPDLQIEPQALEMLQAYHWPGNVRELENVLERAAVLCDEQMITIKDLPALAGDRSSILALPDENLDLTSTLEEIECTLIKRAMARANGVKTEAARNLGIKTTTLLYKLSKYGLDNEARS